MGDEMAHSKKVTDTAIELARMWGVMETLEDIPSMKEVPTNSDDKNKETLVAWAKEYVVTGQTDMLSFLKGKLQKFIS